MQRELYIVDAFTKVRFDGNQAGVVTRGDGLSDEQMQAIAREVNASETAFVLRSKGADLELRFFTPRCEVDFCGHAFVAALYLLYEVGEIKLAGDFARVNVQTGVGLIEAQLVDDAGGVRVEMVQAPPVFRSVGVPLDTIASALGVDVEAFDNELAAELSYTGLWTLIVPIVDSQALARMSPDYKALAALNETLGAVVTMAFAREGEGYRTRGFAPAVGVDEDPVTGSASGALAAYLMRHGQIAAGAGVDLHQRGDTVRGGVVHVVANGTAANPERIAVSGHAKVTVRATVELDDE